MSAVLPKSAQEILQGLPLRQRQVADLLLELRPYKFIGRSLGIKAVSVGTAAQYIFRKFNVTRRDELIAMFHTDQQVGVTRETLLRWASYAAIAEQLRVPGSAAMSQELTDLLQKGQCIKKMINQPLAGDHAL